MMALGVGAAVAALALAGAAGAASARMHFDLPAEAAERSLKRFSEQTGHEVMFASDLTRGVVTNRGKGEMAPREAIDSMLAQTGLVAVQDERASTYSVRRASPAESKNGRRATPTTAGVRPTNQPRRLTATP